MPLHPLAQAFVDQHVAAGFQPVCGGTVEEARAMSAQMFAATPPGDPVAIVEDMRIPGRPASESAGAGIGTSDVEVATRDIPLRVYTPVGEGPFPLVVYFHGGGWVVGDLEAQDADCRTIANRVRCVVVSVDYCLAPEHKFPGPAEDAYQATHWASQNRMRLGGATDTPIAVAGSSAGGNLAAAVALMARDRRGPALACQVLTVPATDCDFETDSYRDNGRDYVLTREEMQWFWEHYLPSPEEADNPYAAPLRSPDLSRLPPTLVQTAEFDPLRDEGRAYADGLAAAGVPVTYRNYEGMIHMVLGPEAMDDVTEFLRETFTPKR